MDGGISGLLRSGRLVAESFNAHSLLLSVTLRSAPCSSAHWALLVYADTSVTIFPGATDFSVRSGAFATVREAASKGDQTATCVVSYTDGRTCKQSRYVEHRPAEVSGFESCSLLATA